MSNDNGFRIVSEAHRAWLLERLSYLVHHMELGHWREVANFLRGKDRFLNTEFPAAYLTLPDWEAVARGSALQARWTRCAILYQQFLAADDLLWGFIHHAGEILDRDSFSGLLLARMADLEVLYFSAQGIDKSAVWVAARELHLAAAVFLGLNLPSQVGWVDAAHSRLSAGLDNWPSKLEASMRRRAAANFGFNGRLGARLEYVSGYRDAVHNYEGLWNVPVDEGIPATALHLARYISSRHLDLLLMLTGGIQKSQTLVWAAYEELQLIKAVFFGLSMSGLADTLDRAQSMLILDNQAELVEWLRDAVCRQAFEHFGSTEIMFAVAPHVLGYRAAALAEV